jgi:arylsulfatase A-like enzyme
VSSGSAPLRNGFAQAHLVYLRINKERLVKMAKRIVLMLLIVVLTLTAHSAERVAAQAGRPNILLIITDDQGYGDLGVHGNPKLHTPHLDRLAGQSVQFARFYVSPVCSPTRASLITGRYNYRTGVVDTYLGRSLMHPDETTLAELLASAGYRTGLFGKWHLGDNYPMRAMDQGFQETLALNGGGIGQPSDPVGGESYFDPLLRRNGQWVKTKGYVSDVITDATLEFISAQPQRPFFAYLAFNAPHTPLEVPAPLYAKYQAMNLRPADFPGINITGGHSFPANFDPDVTAKIYGMVENVDDNIGRLLRRLDDLKLTRDTIVIFMTDNGPQQPRYNAGMFQRKGTVYEGGIRVPFFVRWPAQFAAGRKVLEPAAHIDVVPTLLDACGVKKPARVRFDGVSLLPLLKGTREQLPDRTLFAQWHRGDAPEAYRAFAARNRQYKLVQAAGQNDGAWTPAFKLYDLQRDPFETKDLAAERPEIVAQLKQAYAAWFKDVTSGRDYQQPARIFLGAPQENPVRLTRQDWRGPLASWDARGLGHWEVNVARVGRYDITARLAKLNQAGTAQLVIGSVRQQQIVPAGATQVIFRDVQLPRGAARLECWWETDDTKGGMLDVTVSHR